MTIRDFRRQMVDACKRSPDIASAHMCQADINELADSMHGAPRQTPDGTKYGHPGNLVGRSIDGTIVILDDLVPPGTIRFLPPPTGDFQ